MKRVALYPEDQHRRLRLQKFMPIIKFTPSHAEARETREQYVNMPPCWLTQLLGSVDTLSLAATVRLDYYLNNDLRPPQI